MALHKSRFLVIRFNILKSIHLIGLVALSLSLWSQHQEIAEKPNIWKEKNVSDTTITNLLSSFKKGRFNGHMRYFFSHTNNAGNLTDYYANAFGGGLRFESASFHGFQMALSGFYTFNIGSSPLGNKDVITDQGNRYESQLFNIENLDNKRDLDRMEELYIKYSFRKSFVRFGRQLINTPFINLQDGRMRPTQVSGLWIESNYFKKLHIDLGWIHGVSPRGTVRWFDIASSVGVYPSGVNPYGKPSNYYNNITSKGVLLAGMKYDYKPQIQFEIWNLMFENVLNTGLLQMDIVLPSSKNKKYVLGTQIIRQDAINFGGNVDSSMSYIQAGSGTTILGLKIGVKNPLNEVNINYTHIFGNGRFLMPREWGRDPFYTFMPRERNEGFGNVHAIVLKYANTIQRYRVKTSVSSGVFILPDVKNVTLNKYGMPSYVQANFDFKHTFIKQLEGWDVHLLLVGKKGIGQTYNNSKYIFNKVDMVLTNFVINYHF